MFGLLCLFLSSTFVRSVTAPANITEVRKFQHATLQFERLFVMDHLVAIDNSEHLINQLTEYVTQFMDETKSNDQIVIGLSGGSMIDALVTAFATNSDWKKVKFIFCDERLVPVDNSESTYGQYLTKFGQKCAEVDESNFVTPNLELKGVSCAAAYEESIKQLLGDVTKLDLLFLGMGPDGHTCSLFPGHQLLKSTKLVDFVGDSPKPPPERITLTLKCIEQLAQRVVFVATGASKKPVLLDILGRGPKSSQYPAGLVKSMGGSVTWFVERDVCDDIKN